MYQLYMLHIHSHHIELLSMQFDRCQVGKAYSIGQWMSSQILPNSHKHISNTTVVHGNACVVPYPHATEFTMAHIRKNGTEIKYLTIFYNLYYKEKSLLITCNTD